MYFDASATSGAISSVAPGAEPSGQHKPSQHLSPQQFGKQAPAEAEGAAGAGEAAAGAEGAAAGAGAAEGAAGAAGLADLAPLLLL